MKSLPELYCEVMLTRNMWPDAMKNYFVEEGFNIFLQRT